MAVRKVSFYPGGFGEKFCRFMIDASTTAGAVGLRSTATNSAGEVVNATTTGAADALGVYAETVTYSTTQSAFDGFPADEEGTVAMLVDPFQVLEFLVSGGATAGTALSNTAPGNILINETADSAGLTVVNGTADTTKGVGTVSMAGGLLIGKTGNNVGITRRIITHNNNQDSVVEVPFPRTIAVGDQFFRFPWSLAGQTMQFTSNLVQMDGIIATGTGAPMVPVQLEGLGGVTVDIVNSIAVVHAMFRDHAYNPLG